MVPNLHYLFPYHIFYSLSKYARSLVKCSDCEKVLESCPKTLPCNDILCDRCYNDLLASKRNACANCHEQFEEHWCPRQESEDR